MKAVTGKELRKVSGRMGDNHLLARGDTCDALGTSDRGRVLGWGLCHMGDQRGQTLVIRGLGRQPGPTGEPAEAGTGPCRSRGVCEKGQRTEVRADPNTSQNPVTGGGRVRGGWEQTQNVVRNGSRITKRRQRDCPGRPLGVKSPAEMGDSAQGLTCPDIKTH